MNWYWQRILICSAVGAGMAGMMLLGGAFGPGVQQEVKYLSPLILAIGVNLLYWGWQSTSSFLHNSNFFLVMSGGKWLIFIVIVFFASCFVGYVAFPVAIYRAIRGEGYDEWSAGSPVLRFFVGILIIAGWAWLGYMVYVYFDTFYPFFKAFFFYIGEEEGLAPSNMIKEHIIYSAIAGAVVLFGNIYYLIGLTANGWRPFQRSYLLTALFGGLLLFGVYYGYEIFLYLDRRYLVPGLMIPDDKVILYIMAGGAALLALTLLVMICKKGLRMLPVCLTYIFLALTAAMLVLLVVRGIAYLIVIIIIVIVMASLGRDAG